MMVLGLITDRTQENVNYLASLNRKGWAKMTPFERAIWTGDPLTASDMGWSGGVNLLPTNLYYSEGVTVTFRNSHFVTTGDGYAVVIIGPAKSFAGADITLSVDSITGTGGTLELVWYDGDDTYESIDRAVLTGSGVISVRLDTDTGTWGFLAVRIVVSGGTTVFNKVMLEKGNTRHDYVPYTPILPTEATKGAYNYSDLNRVEMVVEELSEKLGLGLTTKTDWGMWDVPTQNDMSRYRDNLVAIENRLKMGDTMGDIPPDLSRFTFAHANAIENFLLEVSKEV